MGIVQVIPGGLEHKARIHTTINNPETQAMLRR